MRTATFALALITVLVNGGASPYLLEHLKLRESDRPAPAPSKSASKHRDIELAAPDTPDYRAKLLEGAAAIYQSETYSPAGVSTATLGSPGTPSSARKSLKKTLVAAVASVRMANATGVDRLDTLDREVLSKVFLRKLNSADASPVSGVSPQGSSPGGEAVLQAAARAVQETGGADGVATSLQHRLAVAAHADGSDSSHGGAAAELRAGHASGAGPAHAQERVSLADPGVWKK